MNGAMTSFRDKSPRACIACKRYKRRCDKALPSCSLCNRLQKNCDYTNSLENDLTSRVRDLEAVVDLQFGERSSRPEFVSSSSGQVRLFGGSHSVYSATLHYQKFFLETELCGRPAAAPPPPGDMINHSLFKHVGDRSQRQLALNQFFQTIHKWMPIIGRVRLSGLVERECSDRPRADLALLIMAMRLIQHVPKSSSHAIGETLYVKTKELAATLDIAGVLTLLKLQANLLVLLFEMGHGIFPAAYLSLGNCITQAMVLGVHNQNAPHILEPPRGWIDWEERQRVWWVIVIAERYMLSSGLHRPLLTPDPKITSPLPTDDTAWDLGQLIPPDRLVLSSSEQLEASPFSRLAQASHLLGEVIKHCNDKTKTLAEIQSDVNRLSQTINAFLSLVSNGNFSKRRFYSAIGLCLSALMKLADHHSCESFLIQNDGKGEVNISDLTIARTIAIECQSILKNCMTQSLTFISVMNEMMSDDTLPEEFMILTPWFLDCVYQTMANLSYLASTSTSGDAAQYLIQKSLCKRVLRKANRRWKVAGAYLETIDLVDTEFGSQNS